ncbi:MAG: hypothetical protein KGM96_07645 [Acidobacteriota bacterium]|nr:hypothetical protein [Acidobacteriota bacterium]
MLAVLLLSWAGVQAGAQAFDLVGPKVDVRVKRGEVTLPIGEVPNLLPGDRLWVHPDLPGSQSARYVLVVAFLRGATNPPPPEWFTRVETWKRAARDEGVFVTVPQEAQQALLFLAPETGGDFSTLRNAVRGRPGIFVRAGQNLQAASWDRMRLNAYLDQVKVTSQTDPKLLKERSEASARSLGIKVDQSCFLKPEDEQATCLSQHTEGLVMDDAGTQSRVSQIANGSTADLMNQLSYSSMGGAGVYSPYVGAIVDTVKILSSLHTARFQYIPALALPTRDTLNMRLSVPPSFRDPKSVVVIALPPVAPAKMPPLHAVNPAESYCAQKPGLVLPAEGAPLVLATNLAYDLNLHFELPGGPVDLPVKADPAKGGMVLEEPATRLPEGDLTGVVRGKWGFDDWEGPRFHLHSAGPGKWSVAAGDQSVLVVGREDTLHIEGESTLCIDKVEQQSATGGIPLTWKSPKPGLLEVAVPLKDAAPGPVTIQIRQFGLDRPDLLPMKAYSEAASLDSLSLSAGDTGAVLTGTRLDQVAKASLDGINWSPAALSRVKDTDRLAMHADSSTAGLEPGRRYFARVQLLDGRTLRAPVEVAPQRPQVTLLSKGAQDAAGMDPSPVQLGSPDDLPIERRLVFFLKSKTPANFPRNEKVEVAAVDGSFRTVLSLAEGSLMLEDAKTALGVVEPLSRFGSSAFGPVELRAVSAEGVTGDWLPLGTLVRVPGFRELRCPHALVKPCTLTGSNLFLAASIAATPDFDNPVDVPPDFTGTQLTVPHPVNGALYIKLRDDPATVQTLELPVLPMAAGALTPAKAQPIAAPPVEPETPSQPAAVPAAQPASPQTAPAAPPAASAKGKP